MELISGFFSLSAYVTDGDTLAFRADSLTAWDRLAIRPRPSLANPYVRVRLDGVDAPELHASNRAQSSMWGRLALESVANQLGWSAVDWSLTGNVPMNVEEFPGQLLVVGADKFKRVIGVAFPPGIPPSPGYSLNANLVLQGLAYPAIYTTTPADLQAVIRANWKNAVDGGAGFTTRESTQSFNFFDVITDQDDIMVHPKVWRRVQHFGLTSPSLDMWPSYVKGRNDMFQPFTGTTKNLSKVLQLTGSEFTCPASILDASWYVTHSSITSQILRFLSTIAR